MTTHFQIEPPHTTISLLKGVQPSSVRIRLLQGHIRVTVTDGKGIVEFVDELSVSGQGAPSQNVWHYKGACIKAERLNDEISVLELTVQEYKAE